MASAPSSELRAAVGVTIITGFLGSGKSTLIRRVLTENHGLRVVVVENEFSGASAVESAIVTQGLGPAAFEDFVELPNGCICCTAQSELTSALSRLVRERETPIDHILVEASGVADPGPVAASFWVDAELGTELRLDGVVAVVDALHAPRTLRGACGDDDDAVSDEATRVLAEKQVAVADVVVLNKRDLVADAQFERVSAAVAAINGTAEMLVATRCDVDIRSVLGIRAYDAAVAGESAMRIMRHADHVVTGAATVTVRFEGGFEEGMLDRALGTLLWEEDEEGMEIWRMKGLVCVVGEECLRVYQGVHTLFEGEETDVRVGDEESVESCFIFIGRALREGRICDVLSAAVAKDG